jgi:hypothetical protein
MTAGRLGIETEHALPSWFLEEEEVEIPFDSVRQVPSQFSKIMSKTTSFFYLSRGTVTGADFVMVL